MSDLDDDALDPRHDPYPLAPRAGPEPRGTSASPTLSRRSLLLAPALAPALVACAGRAGRALSCAPTPGDAEHCTARFCRYHSG